MSETQQLTFGDVGEDEYEALTDYEPQPVQSRNRITNPPMANSKAGFTPMNTTSGSSMRPPPGISVPPGSTLSLEDFARANVSIREANRTFRPEPFTPLPPGIDMDNEGLDSIYDMMPDDPTYAPQSP